MLRSSRGLSTLEWLLALAILAVLAFLVLGGRPGGERPPSLPGGQDRAVYDGEALAKFAEIQRAATEHLSTHGNLFTWVTAQDLGLRPTPNWTYSLRRLSALEIAVYAHGRGRISGRRWRMVIRSDGAASTALEAP
jgi:hypothetical protein